MEFEFKNISKKAKAVLNTFESAIFIDSRWYLSLQNSECFEPKQAEVTPVKKHELELTQSPLIKVIFLGDTYAGIGEDLLHKMILAMNLGANSVKRMPFDEKSDDLSSLLKIISENRPEVVVSLGAITTNLLLEKKEKLSGIHGQLIPLETSNWKYLLVPVFHPDFLMINPNMKRTAWNDLQKIMEYFKKDS